MPQGSLNSKIMVTCNKAPCRSSPIEVKYERWRQGTAHGWCAGRLTSPASKREREHGNRYPKEFREGVLILALAGGGVRERSHHWRRTVTASSPERYNYG